MKFLKAKRKNNLFIVLGLLMFIGSLFLWINKQATENRLFVEEERAIEVFFEQEKISEENTETKQEIEENTTVSYIAVLEIPKINLKRGLVNKTDPSNNVKYNVAILKETIFPNNSGNSHIILAGHSGTANNAYFKNLHKLDMKDKIYFYYKKIKYIYEVSNIYEVEKTGQVSLKLTQNSDITLITCVSGTNKQVVYIATLIKKINY